MAQENFFDILVDELRRSIRQELESEMRPENNVAQALGPRTSFEHQMIHDLNIELQPKYFRGQKNGYFRKSTRLRTPIMKLDTSRPPRRAMTDPESLAFQLLKNCGALLKENFNERELKKEFRKLAHLCHPDRANFAKSPHLFTDVRAAYELLIRFLQN